MRGRGYCWHVWERDGEYMSTFSCSRLVDAEAAMTIPGHNPPETVIRPRARKLTDGVWGISYKHRSDTWAKGHLFREPCPPAWKKRGGD